MKAFKQWSDTHIIASLYGSLQEEICSRYSLPNSALDVMTMLKIRPELNTVSEIAEWTRYSKPYVSQVVDNLMKRGYIVSERSTNDRRRFHLRLTEAAEPVMDDVFRMQRRWYSILWNGISEEEQRRYLAVSKKIIENATSFVEDIGHPEDTEE